MTTADLIASLVAGFFLLIVGIFLIVKIRSARPASIEATAEGDLEREVEASEPVVEATVFETEDDEIRLESDEETDLAISSLENLEFRVDADVLEEDAPLEELPASNSPLTEEITAMAPESEIAADEVIETEGEAEIGAEPEVEVEIEAGPTSPFEWVATEEAADQPIEEPASFEEATEIEEAVVPEFVETDIDPAISEATAEPEAEPVVSETEEVEEVALAEIEAEADQIHAEIESLTENDEDLRRATLRPAPKRNRRDSEVKANLDNQISDLDHRLDALEALVSSIEESLAEFEPLLEEEEGAPAHRTAHATEDQAAAA